MESTLFQWKVSKPSKHKWGKDGKSLISSVAQAVSHGNSETESEWVPRYNDSRRAAIHPSGNEG